jgi:hypothetical protein
MLRDYYHRSRTLLALTKDSPPPRPIQRPRRDGSSRFRWWTGCTILTSGAQPDRPQFSPQLPSGKALPILTARREKITRSVTGSAVFLCLPRSKRAQWNDILVRRLYVPTEYRPQLVFPIGTISKLRAAYSGLSYLHGMGGP